jgi:hypothetical protein
LTDATFVTAWQRSRRWTGSGTLASVPTRRDCGLTPAWRGILWVCQLGDLGPYPDLIGGKWRVWSKILVAGDEDLMDRIEQVYRNK